MRFPGIFVCYRREDSAADAGRIVDNLKARLGRNRVFRDVDAIRPGTDFVAAIERALDHCSAFVAVIGPHWLDARDEAGRRRLDDPRDFIRREVAFALQHGVRVVPALVQGAEMPEERDLPEDLRALRRIQAVELSDPRWDYDMSRLVRAIKGRRRRRLGRWRAAAVAALLVAAGATAYWLWPAGAVPSLASPGEVTKAESSPPPEVAAGPPASSPNAAGGTDSAAARTPKPRPTPSLEPAAPPPQRPRAAEPSWPEVASTPMAFERPILGPLSDGPPPLVSIRPDRCPPESLALDLCATGYYARRDLESGWMLTRASLAAVASPPPLGPTDTPWGLCLGAPLEASARLGDEQVAECAEGYYSRRRIESGWMLLSTAVEVQPPVPLEVEYLEGSCFTRAVESGERFDPRLDLEDDCPAFAYSSEDLGAGARLAEGHLDASYGARWHELVDRCLVRDVRVGEPLDAADVESCDQTTA